MKPEEQRIAIAKHRGWYEPLRNSLGGPNCYIPKYTEDLNAIRDAVMWLPHVEQLQFEFNLSKTAESKGGFVHRLTAADWCKCYLQVAGKWKEEE